MQFEQVKKTLYGGLSPALYVKAKRYIKGGNCAKVQHMTMVRATNSLLRHHKTTIAEVRKNTMEVMAAHTAGRTAGHRSFNTAAKQAKEEPKVEVKEEQEEPTYYPPGKEPVGYLLGMKEPMQEDPVELYFNSASNYVGIFDEELPTAPKRPLHHDYLQDNFPAPARRLRQKTTVF